MSTSKQLSPCSFLGLPIEIRYQIYSHLLPNIKIPATWSGRALRDDFTGVHLAILRLNQRIHLEAINYLYGAREFEIHISNSGIKFLGNTQLPQDVMLANRWNCPIGGVDFSLINSLRVTIDLRTTMDAPIYRSNSISFADNNPLTDHGSSAPHPSLIPSGSVQYGLGCTEKRLRVVSQLIDLVVKNLSVVINSAPLPLARLTLAYCYNNAATSPDNGKQVMSMTSYLLGPFWNLRNITDPNVGSVNYGQFNEGFVFEKVDLKQAKGDSLGEEELTFLMKLKEWKRTLQLSPIT